MESRKIPNEQAVAATRLDGHETAHAAPTALPLWMDCQYNPMPLR